MLLLAHLITATALSQIPSSMHLLERDPLAEVTERELKRGPALESSSDVAPEDLRTLKPLPSDVPPVEPGSAWWLVGGTLGTGAWGAGLAAVMGAVYAKGGVTSTAGLTALGAGTVVAGVIGYVLGELAESGAVWARHAVRLLVGIPVASTLIAASVAMVGMVLLGGAQAFSGVRTPGSP